MYCQSMSLISKCQNMTYVVGTGYPMLAFALLLHEPLWKLAYDVQAVALKATFEFMLSVK